MKIIDLLNKIANGEIETFYKFQYRNKIVTMGYLLDNYLFLEILNDEIESIEDTPKEEKKIPEKLTTWFSLEKDYENNNIQYANYNFERMYEKINEICDYLKSKGE